MRLRICSDGTPRGTLVQDEFGEVIHGIQRILFELDVREPRAKVTLTFAGPHQVEADVEYTNAMEID